METPESVLKQLLAATDKPLAAAEDQVRKAEAQVEQIRAERYGLELALARLQDATTVGGVIVNGRDVTGAAPAPNADPENQWVALDRTDAIERVLKEAGKPIHRKVLVKTLHDHGRDDTIELVSAALAYLKRKFRAMNFGDGFWGIVDFDDRPQDESDPAETGSPTVSVSSTEEGGGSRDGRGDRDHHAAVASGM